MTAVESPVPEFSISCYPPHLISTIIFCAVLAVTVAAGAWFWKRLYLHVYGVRTEGTVKESAVTSSRVANGEFSASSKVYTRDLIIEYTGPGRHEAHREREGLFQRRERRIESYTPPRHEGPGVLQQDQFWLCRVL